MPKIHVILIIEIPSYSSELLRLIGEIASSNLALSH